MDEKYIDSVLKALCELSWNYYGIDVFPARTIAGRIESSYRKVLNALHVLRDRGLVKRSSMGCPAVESCGEYHELECEAAPPINGWSLTEKGNDTKIAELAYQEYCEGLRKWAES